MLHYLKISRENKPFCISSALPKLESFERIDRAMISVLDSVNPDLKEADIRLLMIVRILWW
jgi:hypothetical protein